LAVFGKNLLGAPEALKFIIIINRINFMHIRAVDLNLMPVFSALLVHRTVSGAADQLGLTQPAVSHALARLRQHYDDPLFQRVSNRMVPTARALEIAPSIETALDLLKSTFYSKFDPAELRRSFRIGLINYSGFYLLPALTERLSVEAPHVQIIPEQMDIDTAQRLMAAREIDFAVGVSSTIRDDFTREPLFDSGFSIILSRAHALANEVITPALLATCRRVNVPIFAPYEANLRHPPLTYAITCPDLLSLPLVVARSDLVAIVPTRLGQLFEATFQVKLADMDFALPDADVDLVFQSKQKMDIAQRWLKEMIVDICKVIEAEMKEYYLPQRKLERP